MPAGVPTHAVRVGSRYRDQDRVTEWRLDRLCHDAL